MAEIRLVYPLDTQIFPATVGVQDGNPPGVSLTDRRDLAMCQVFASAKRGKETRLTRALGIAKGARTATETGEFTAMPLSPRQWMLVGESGRDGAFTARIRELVANNGHVSDQGHGRVIIRIAGPRARDVLAKGCSLDLHPGESGAGFCAQTQIAQIGVLIHQANDEPAYDIAVYAGFADSFWHWLTEAAAEFGYRADVWYAGGS